MLRFRNKPNRFIMAAEYARDLIEGSARYDVCDAVAEACVLFGIHIDQSYPVLRRVSRETSNGLAA